MFWWRKVHSKIWLSVLRWRKARASSLQRIIFVFFCVMEKSIAWGRFKASDKARRATGRTHARYSATSGCTASPRVVQKLAQNKLSIAFAAARHTLLTNRACPLCASAILIISSDLFFSFFCGSVCCGIVGLKLPNSAISRASWAENAMKRRAGSVRTVPRFNLATLALTIIRFGIW